MADLFLQDLRKSYEDGSEILRGINLTVVDGEFLVFVGPSGCGKSTLLRCIAGLEDITAGLLEIGGKRVNEIPPSQRGIAMVFQSYALYPHMSVEQNMAFGLRLAGMARAAIDEAVRGAAKILQIEHLLSRKPKALSGGQRQRVAIGRAIVRTPGVFLFDEPLSNLDASLRVQMRVELARLHRELKTTMIYVTHDQVEAMTLAHRIVVLQAGQIEQVGTPMDLYHRPANLFVAGFIGSPKMNFLGVEVVSARAEAVTVTLPGGGQLTVAVHGGGLHPFNKLTLGVRPEHIQVADTAAGASLSGLVQVAEHLGDTTFLHVRVQGLDDNFLVRTDPDNPLAAGDTAHLVFPPGRCHLFNAEGMALERHAVPAAFPSALPNPQKVTT